MLTIYEVNWLNGPPGIVLVLGHFTNLSFGQLAIQSTADSSTWWLINLPNSKYCKKISTYYLTNLPISQLTIFSTYIFIN